MTRHSILVPPFERSENEGPGLRSSGDSDTSGVTRFLTQFYVVGGQAYPSLAAAAARALPLELQETAL